MTEWPMVETEYSSERRPEYEQLFVDEDSEAVEYLNEIYSEEDCIGFPIDTGFSFRDVARNLPDTERREMTGLPSKKDYPVTEDGYRWQEEIIRSDSSWRKSVPFVDYQEIAVLFPQKKPGMNSNGLGNGEIGLGALLVRQGYSSDKAQRIAEEKKQEAKEKLENNPHLRHPHSDRSVAVYATDNVETDEAEQFLWELADALEGETVDK